MVFGKTRLEMKVGVFVFIGLLILMTFVLFIGDVKNIFAAYKVNFIFNFVNGVKTGAPIRYSGVDIGEIREIVFVPSDDLESTKVKLVGYIKKDVKIPANSDVWINTLGLLGEKYIEIMPAQATNNYVTFNGSLVGHDPMAMQEFGELAKSIATKLDSGLVEVKTLVSSLKDSQGTIGKLLYDEKLYNEIDLLVSDIRRNPWKLFWKTKEKPIK